jgi:hypothetical protein
MEADVFERGDPFGLTQVVAVAVAKTKDGAPRTKHFLPEMRKGMRRGAGVYCDELRGICSLSAERSGSQCAKNENEPDTTYILGEN